MDTHCKIGNLSLVYKLTTPAVVVLIDGSSACLQMDSLNWINIEAVVDISGCML